MMRIIVGVSDPLGNVFSKSNLCYYPAVISSSSKYAIRALLCLAAEEDRDFVPVEVLAEEADVPSAFLSKIIQALAAEGLLETRRGKSGGVRLCEGPLSFFDICEALHDPVIYETCLLSNSRCSRVSPCPFHDHWFAERARIRQFLRDLKIPVESSSEGKG